jgi:hypothetical protein
VSATVEREGFAVRRKKLWELDSRFHCPVIGTCLTVDELHRLVRKAGISVGVKMSDYELHHSFVQVAGNPVHAARLTHKWLDRKFEPALKRFNACKCAAELEPLWEEASAQGDVAAAFWALLTHPAAPAELVQRAYEEVHMLSHLAGHSHRVAQRELAALKQRVTEIEERHAWTAEASRLRIQELEREVGLLSERARRADALERELAATQARLAAFEHGEPLARLRAEKDALARELERAARRAENAERRLRAEERPALADAAVPVSAGAVAGVLAAGCPPRCDAPEAGDCPGPDLCGRRVLYVGGRNRQVAHFRAFVARHNGVLLHHDGGLSESTLRLDAMIHRADAVLCPVGCVSHDACRRVKRLCRRAAKPFVPLRSASLACFVQGLQEVAA